MWLSLVERCVRDAEVAGSNPVTPILSKSLLNPLFGRLFVFHGRRPVRRSNGQEWTSFDLFGHCLVQALVQAFSERIREQFLAIR